MLQRVVSFTTILLLTLPTPQASVGFATAFPTMSSFITLFASALLTTFLNALQLIVSSAVQLHVICVTSMIEYPINVFWLLTIGAVDQVFAAPAAPRRVFQAFPSQASASPKVTSIIFAYFIFIFAAIKPSASSVLLADSSGLLARVLSTFFTAKLIFLSRAATAPTLIFPLLRVV